MIRTWLSRYSFIGPLLALICVYSGFAVASPDTFFSSVNFFTMLRQTVVVGIAAMGATLVILSGGIDLSVGSLVALVTVVLARLLQAGLGPAAAATLTIALAGLCGAANGAAVVALKITPFIVTLGAMSLLRGLAKGVAHEQKIDANPQGLDEWMAQATPEQVWAVIPAGVWLTVFCALFCAALLRYTRPGRYMLAIGSNELTALMCGVPVRSIKILTYALAGALAGLAGVMEFSTLTVGDPTDSLGLELEVIAAVVIGGGSLAGGQASIVGTLVGAFLMTVIKTGSTHVGLPNWVQEMAAGAIIVSAVALDRMRSKAQ